ncbi:MAG: TonB-dependent receptor [Planctomycetes bacterium]|nr:TonB-dependent receptor [Planctomycetota bacterium]
MPARRLLLVPTLAVIAALPGEEATAPPATVPEMVVTATRLEAAPEDQPYAIHHHDRAELDRSAGRTLTDRISLTPGVIVQKTAPNQASPFIRGLTGEQTLLLLDGMRLSHAMMRPGANQYSALVADQSVGDVDVILGSGSTTLGSDALTGAIDYRLAPAGRGVGKPLSPYVRGRVSTAEGWSTAAGLDGEAGDWAYTVEGGFADYHDLEGGKDSGDHLTPPRSDDTIPNTSYEQIDWAARAAYLGVADQRFELAAGQSRQNDAPRPDGYAANSGNVNNIARFYDPQLFTYAHARHELRAAGPFDRIRTTLSMHEHAEDQTRERIVTAVDRVEQYEDVITAYGLDLQLTSSLAAHQFTYGASGYREGTDNDYTRFDNGVRNVAQSANPGNTTVPDDAEYTSLGVYAQDLWRFASRWSLLAGVRFDRNAWDFTVSDSRAGFDGLDGTAGNNNPAFTADFSDSAQAVTGNLRLAFDASDEVMLFTGLSSGFRAPNLSNLAGVQDRGSSGLQIQGNPELNPERSYTAEIGTKYAGDPGSASFTVFATRIDDLIQPIYPAGPGNPTAGNAERALLVGGEIASDLTIPTGDLLPSGHRLVGYQATSYVSGEADLSQPGGGVDEVHISKANRCFGHAGLRWELQRAWWTASQVRWSDRYDEVGPGDASDRRHLTFAAKGGPAGAMPGFAVLDWLVGWRSADGALFATGAVENVLDHSYRVPGSATDGAGLNLVLTVGARL